MNGLDDQVLGVLQDQAGRWVAAEDVARVCRRNVYDGVVQALDRLVEQGLALQDDDLTWRYCASVKGLRVVTTARNGEGNRS